MVFDATADGFSTGISDGICKGRSWGGNFLHSEVEGATFEGRSFSRESAGGCDDRLPEVLALGSLSSTGR